MSRETKSRQTLRFVRAGGRGERMFGTFLLGLALFNPPLLHVFAQGGMVFGIPILFVYLFSAWLGLIGLMALSVERGRDSAGGEEGE